MHRNESPCGYRAVAQCGASPAACSSVAPTPTAVVTGDSNAPVWSSDRALRSLQSTTMSATPAAAKVTTAAVEELLATALRPTEVVRAGDSYLYGWVELLCHPWVGYIATRGWDTLLCVMLVHRSRWLLLESNVRSLRAVARRNDAACGEGLDTTRKWPLASPARRYRPTLSPSSTFGTSHIVRFCCGHLRAVCLGVDCDTAQALTQTCAHPALCVIHTVLALH